MSSSGVGFRFYGAEEILFVSGESPELVGRARARLDSGAPVLFWRPGDDAFHLLDGGDALFLAELDGPEVAGFLARRRAEVIATWETPEHPAVVLDADGFVVGAWFGGEARAKEVPADEISMREVSNWRANRSTDLGMALPDAPPPEPPSPQRPAGEAVIRRTPHLDAPAEIPTAPGSVIEVAIRTDRQPFKEAEEGADVVIDAPPEVREIELEVQLSVSDHFEVEGAATQSLRIRREEDDSEPLRYRLRVRDDPPERTAGLCALFTYNRRPCGHVVRAWRWSNKKPKAPTAPGHKALPASLPVHIDTEPPDVAVYITAPVADGMHFRCSVSTDLIPGYETPIPVDFGLKEKASDLIARKLEQITLDSLTAKQRREALDEAGYAFWEVAPPVFKEAIWALYDAGKAPCTLYIASAEPSLPWELMIPTRHDGEEPEEIGPLGVEFAIGRWSRGDAVSPPQRIPVRNTFVVAPKYECEPLDSAAEVAFVNQYLNGIELEEATIDSLDAHFLEEHASVLHFICHGAEYVEEDEGIYLDNDEMLRSEAVRPLKGFKALCRARAPLVFVNACNAGAQKPSLAGGAGFPRAFGDIGARAVLAPLWPVSDVIAAKVATTLYQEALKPGAKSVAEVMRSIRALGYKKNDADTYAAYAFYGDPLAKLELVLE